MGVLVDASILIEAEHGRLDLEPHIARHPNEEMFLSVITASELLHGVHRAHRAEQRAARSAFVEGLLQRFPVLDVDLATSRSHARLWAELAAVGQPIGAHDMWLAAACVAHGFTMITANTREFSRVPGLRFEVWQDGG